MQFAASSAIYVSFFIFQLAHLTHGAFWRFGRNSKATTDTTERASGSADMSKSWIPLTKSSELNEEPGSFEYWIPLPQNPKLEEKLATQQTRIFPENELITGKNKEMFYNRFLQLLKDNYIQEFYFNLIQMGFKNVFKQPYVKEGQAQKWVEFLSNDVLPVAGEKSEVIVTSALYGLYSLRLRCSNYHIILDPPNAKKPRQALLGQVDMLIESLEQDMKQKYKNTGPEMIWQKEILAPQNGFSADLEKPQILKMITENDEDLRCTVSENFGLQLRAFKKLKAEFHFYSANKRVVILAALYQSLQKATLSDPHLAKQIWEKIPNEGLLPHETELTKFINLKIQTG